MLLRELRISGNKKKTTKKHAAGRRSVRFLHVGTGAVLWFESKVRDNVSLYQLEYPQHPLFFNLS